MARHSKVQLQILSLYKQFMRESKNKPGLKAHVRQEFKRNAKEMKKTDVLQIEYLVRRAERQLEMVKNDSVTDVGHFVKS